MQLNLYVKDPAQKAKACIIWMHGLGANAQDMMGLAEQLSLHQAVRHVFLDAPIRSVTLNNGLPMRAWYDIVGIRLNDREDRDGITQSQQMIRQAIQAQVSEGFIPEQIFLAGFSQGGAMALYAGLQSEQPLGGLIALSAYLPLATELMQTQNTHLPIFMASGKFDPIVLPEWTKLSYDHLLRLGLKSVTLREYPMDHSICMDEMHDLMQWLDSSIMSLSGEMK